MKQYLLPMDLGPPSPDENKTAREQLQSIGVGEGRMIESLFGVFCLFLEWQGNNGILEYGFGEFASFEAKELLFLYKRGDLKIGTNPISRRGHGI